jgi:hypothetical protein
MLEDAYQVMHYRDTTNNGIPNVKLLHNSVSKFLYNYQKAIPFVQMPYTKSLQPNRKYWFKNGFRIKTERDFYYDILGIWITEAEKFLYGKPEETDKILAIYSELDYHYQHQDSYNRNDLQRWRFKMNKDGIIEHKCEKVTLAIVLGGLITYQEGIYNDNENTRNWGLYKSSFYNTVMLQVLNKIVNEIGTTIIEPNKNLEIE